MHALHHDLVSESLSPEALKQNKSCIGYRKDWILMTTEKILYTKRALYFDIGLFSPVVILTGCLASVDKRLHQN